MTSPLEPLFRHEAGRLVATLTRIFGASRLALAEDVAQDALCRALETWTLRGVPDDPAAWLLTTARNRVYDELRRQRRARSHESELARLVESEPAVGADLEAAADPGTALADQLRMMFSCCSPRLSHESQIALVLHVLCGFSVGEIAAAFLARPDMVKKRLTRAKALLAASRSLFELTRDDFVARLAAVQQALYLLFNEGFHGASTEAAVRVELCREAMRLGTLLCAHPPSATPETHALVALMFLHAARLPARLDAAGGLTGLLDQDRARWDASLIAEGQRLLDASAAGDTLSAYHVEAAIAWHHISAADAASTPWPRIAALYDLLLRLRPGPVVALSRALAIAQAEGPARGLEELQAIASRERLAGYPFFWAALAELELGLGRDQEARGHFGQALRVARNAEERRHLERRLAEGRAGREGSPASTAK